MLKIYKSYLYLLSVITVISCQQKNPNMLLLTGNKLHQAGKISEAKEIYLRITEIDPNYALAYYNVGIIDMSSNQFETAVDYFSSAIERDPMYGKAYLMRGRCFIKLGRVKMAENDFLTAQLDSKTTFEARSELGRLLISHRRFTEGIRILDQCLQSRDTNQLVLLTRASGLFETNQYKKSLRDCNRVLGMNKERWEAYLIKAKNFLEIPRLDSVEINLEYARLYSNDEPQVLAAYSEYHLLMDESALAIAFAEKGLKYNPDNIPLKINKARALDGMEQFEKANMVYAEIGQLADSIPEFHFYLAQNMLYLGDTASAIIELTDAVALRRDYPQAYTLRSIIKAKVGDAVGSAEDRERAKGELLWKVPSSISSGLNVTSDTTVSPM